MKDSYISTSKVGVAAKAKRATNALNKPIAQSQHAQQQQQPIVQAKTHTPVQSAPSPAAAASPATSTPIKKTEVVNNATHAATPNQTPAAAATPVGATLPPVR